MNKIWVIRYVDWAGDWKTFGVAYATKELAEGRLEDMDDVTYHMAHVDTMDFVAC
jgi:hypothetical protein